MLAATQTGNLPPIESGKPAAAKCVLIETWEEEAYQVSISITRALSEGKIRRDPALPVKAPKASAPKTPPLVSAGRGRVLGRWRLNLQKQAHNQNTTVEALLERERLRGIRRRQEAKRKAP